jgi:MarR family transcriptional regulator, organic hydroperoxide resistance regulator
MNLPSVKTSSAAANKSAGPHDRKRRGDPAFPESRIADSPLYRIVRAAGRYTLNMENALKSSGMDLMSYRALNIVNEASPSSVSAIAERSVSRLSTMTRVVRRLEKKGFVRLTNRPSDGRVTDVHLTSQGKQAIQSVRAVASQIYNAALDGFSSAEIAVLNSMMHRVFSNLMAQSTQD